MHILNLKTQDNFKQHKLYKEENENNIKVKILRPHALVSLYLQMVTAAMKLKDAYSLEGKL